MSSQTRPFQGYAKFYDQMYQQKDYEAECDFLESAWKRFLTQMPRTVLDLGCGTGNHAIPLAKRGYVVHGVDFSKEMLTQASQKSTEGSLQNNLSWTESDIVDLRLGQNFDSVICMFAVLSYQISNEQLRKTFETVRAHLSDGGLFICDFWYGPAVLRDPPGTSEKDLNLDKGKTRKSASSEIDYNNHVVRVNYELTTLSDSGPQDVVQESHLMRYLFLPELSLLAELAGLRLAHSCDCCKLEIPASEKSWTVSAIFQA